jgi:hypothetical protein
LAYVKKEIQIKGTKYPIGTIFPVKVIEDEDETLFKVTYPKASFSVKSNGFAIKSRDKEFSNLEFGRSFNLIDPAKASVSSFPLWIESKYSKTEWGCGVSKEVVNTIDASARASVEAEGGFFGFFQAKAEAIAGAGTTTSYKEILKDPSFKHRITYFNLVSEKNKNKTLLKLALEKISVCDASKGVNNSYIIRFDKNLALDEIKINSVWATDKGFSRGGGSPVRIDNQKHLEKFENSLKDFKFNQPKYGYNTNRAIIDFAVWYTVNLNYEAE